MATYTFITEYRGGTYISQQTAGNLLEACGLWKRHVVSGKYIQALDLKQFSRSFDADIEELPPVTIDQVQNVWLFQLLVEDEMLSAHIIQTDLSTSDVAGIPSTSLTPM
jgi:hypothetical protein